MPAPLGLWFGTRKNKFQTGFQHNLCMLWGEVRVDFRAKPGSLSKNCFIIISSTIANLWCSTLFFATSTI